MLASLALASPAAACVCADAPMSERLDASDAAVVGRVTGSRTGDLNGAPQLFLTVEIEQRVKGDVDGPLEVRSPLGTDCDVGVPRGETFGWLLTKGSDGAWVATACSVVSPGELVFEGGEPRGGPIKVVVGIVILALVLLWALRRLRRGTRPDLPGAPGP